MCVEWGGGGAGWGRELLSIIYDQQTRRLKVHTKRLFYGLISTTY